MSDKEIRKLLNNKRFTFEDVLTLMFIYLKLTNQITWSWWFVLLPIIITTTLRIILRVVLGIKDIINEINR